MLRIPRSGTFAVSECRPERVGVGNEETPAGAWHVLALRPLTCIHSRDGTRQVLLVKLSQR